MEQKGNKNEGRVDGGPEECALANGPTYFTNGST